MMNFKKISLSVLGLLLSFGVFAQVKFKIVYDDEGYDYARSVWQTHDQGYIIVGFSNTYNYGSQVMLMKTDSMGQRKWKKHFGNELIQTASAIQQIEDSSYVVVGTTNQNVNNGYDILMMKFSREGDSLWTKTFGGEDWDTGEFLEQTADGGFIIAGSTFSYGNGGEDVYIIKTDSEGNMEWSKTYGGPQRDYGKAIRQCDDLGYVIAATTESFGAGGEDMYIIRTDPNGDTVWTSTVGDIGDDRANFVEETQDGDFVVTGYTADPTTGILKPPIVKLDANGDEVFFSIFGAAVGEEHHVVHETHWGRYALGGYNLGGAGGGGKDFVLVSTGLSGWWEFARTYGDLNDEMAYSMQVTNDNGYVLVGESNSFGDGLVNVFLVKTDSMGSSVQNISVGVEENQVQEFSKSFSYYPNPTSDKLFLSLSEKISKNENVDLSILDLNGKQVFGSRHSVQPTIEVDLGHLSSGLYFLRLIQGSEIIGTKKLIVKANP